MFQKENPTGRAAPLRKDRKGVASKLTGEANDYVLKCYQLEENRLFKQKLNEDLRFEVKQQKNMAQAEGEEDLEDELVIVPLELSRCKEVEMVELAHPQKQPDPQEIFVFDDDDEDIQEEDTSQVTPTQHEKSSYRSQENSLIGETTNSQLINNKPSFRDNWSAAELITPMSMSQQFPKKRSEFDPNQALEKNCKNEYDRQASNQRQNQEEGIENLKGVKIGKQSLNKHVSITITDKKLFSLSKLPSGIILKCIIKRTSSILNMMSPEFDLYLANGLKHILSAKKYPLRNRELFKFSVNPLRFDIENQIAAMHANVNHNIYWVLDQPRRIGDMDLSLIYLVIGYYKLKSEEKQRQFTTLLPPTANSQYQLAMDYELSSINFSNIKEEIKTEISNLKKWKNQSLNSTKNFVLADADDPDYRYLEMKKESDDVFELTIQHPFSPLQAMAIAMTRFDVQLK